MSRVRLIILVLEGTRLITKLTSEKQQPLMLEYMGKKIMSIMANSTSLRALEKKASHCYPLSPTLASDVAFGFLSDGLFL